jgi:hypothetical protein
MSNYVKATDFASKDALLTGDPLKIVSGTEINDEFNAIQTAVNTKADINSPTLTGAPSAPTAGDGTNTTQLATTKFVTTAVSNYSAVVDAERAAAIDAAIDAAILATKLALHPVGSIYTNSTNSTNPATLLGFGTWAAFGAGRVVVGFDSGDSDFSSAEGTGGAKSHTLTVAEMPEHSHTAILSNGEVGGTPIYPTGAISQVLPTYEMNTNDAGGGNAHNIVQPYITVYMWKRTD